MLIQDVDIDVRTEIQYGLVNAVVYVVSPGADQQLGALAGFLRTPFLPETVEIAEILVLQVVVPAGDEVGGRFDLTVLFLDSVAFPVIVVGRMPDPVLQPGQIGNIVQGGDQRQAGKELVPVQDRVVVMPGPCRNCMVLPAQKNPATKVTLSCMIPSL